MAKNCYIEQNIIKLIGTLDKNENGEYICVVEDKNSVEEYLINDILNKMIGTEISLQSVGAVQS